MHVCVYGEAGAEAGCWHLRYFVCGAYLRGSVKFGSPFDDLWRGEGRVQRERCLRGGEAQGK